MNNKITIIKNKIYNNDILENITDGEFFKINNNEGVYIRLSIIQLGNTIDILCRNIKGKYDICLKPNTKINKIYNLKIEYDS